jgi:hypothetical protein
MDVQEHLKDWLHFQAPTIWFLLNKKAQSTLPSGIVEYIGAGDPAEIEARKAGLVMAERHLHDLIDLCRDAAVLATYRRDLSGVSTTTQLAELLCEITLCTSLARLSPQKPKLRPPSGTGTSCDVAVQLAGHTVYCEAKRYEDPWPTYQGPVSRSIFKSPPDDKPQAAIRPRHMDLQSKLEGVPRQFPQGTVNILFVFHLSLGESARYIQQSLFGEATFLMKPTEVALQGDGLFMTDAWRAVSACYLSRVQSDGNLVCPTGWQNPRAFAPVPAPVHELLDRLRSPSRFEGNRGV